MVGVTVERDVDDQKMAARAKNAVVCSTWAVWMWGDQ